VILLFPTNIIFLFHTRPGTSRYKALATGSEH